MVQSCIVRGCGKESGMYKVKFHRLPKDESLRNLWIKAINRVGYIVKDHWRVCRDHFSENDYDSRGILKPDVVPNLFLWKENQRETKEDDEMGNISHEDMEIPSPTVSWTVSPTPTTSQVVPKLKSRKRQLGDLTSEVTELRNIPNNLRYTYTEKNDNEAFGQYVAASLNKLPTTQAILAQADIQSLLTQYRLAARSASATSSSNDSI